MATQTKGKTKARATATAKVQATVKAATATGSGNLYTQNISTVKEHTVKVESRVCNKESSAAKLAEMQNNKTKIKISQHKTKRNHLKFLINLYIKLTLCISQLNKTTLQIFKSKTKINTNFSYTNNLAPQCIINLQQKLRQKAQSFKTFSFFKYKLVIEFLTRFHYSQRKAVINYVKLTIKHFIGICLKRLISLKRLQQIPENHKHLDASLRYDTENLKQRILIKKCIVSLSHKKFMKSLKASISLRTQRIEIIQNARYYHTSVNNCCTEKLLINEIRCTTYGANEAFYKKCGQRSAQNSSELQDQVILEKQLTAIKEIQVEITAGIMECKLRHFFKSGHPDLISNIGNTRVLKALVDIQLQNNISLNKRELQKRAFCFLKECCQLFIISKYIFLNKYQTKALEISPNSQGESINKCYIPRLFDLYKYCQQDRNMIALEHCSSNENGNKVSVGRHAQIFQIINIYQHFKLLGLITDFYFKCDDEQVKAHLLLKAQASLKIKHNEMEKIKTSGQQQFKSNSLQKCGQRRTYRILFKQVLKAKNKLRNNFKPKLQETVKRFFNQIVIFRNFNIGEFSTNSPLKCNQLDKQNSLLNINHLRDQHMRHDLRFHIENKAVMILEKLIEAIKADFSSVVVKHKLALIVSKKSLNIDMKNRSYEQKISIHLASLYNCSISQHLLQHSGHFIENKFQNTTSSILKASQSQKIFANTSHNQPNVHQKFCIANGIRRQTVHISINGIQEIKLAYKTNNARQLQLDDNNNSYQVESKQKRVLKKCQHILYSILLFYICCSCYWHIYGFPLVLVKIFKYLKDATVNVLTRRLKVSATTTITTATATSASALGTSMCHNDGNIKAACDGKLNKPTKVADYYYKANQQNILKRQTTHTHTSFSASAYSSSYCSRTLLTTSSSYCKCLKNLTLLHKQPQQPCTPCCCCCCCCQEYQHHHQHLYHPHHYYQYNRQRQLKQQRQQHHHEQQQQYKFIATIHLQLPSLLVFSRTLIILMLLSSLWHTSEGFHGSGVKLSTNTVRTKYGLLRGIVVRSSPSLVEAYLGIPYASPPVGSLRFMPPITPSTWKNTRNADRFSPVCPQNVPIPPNGPEALLEVPRARLAQLRRLLPLLSNQSEDCLYLNIYVPIQNRRHRRFTTNSGELSDTPKLPAILFIHGESYEWNSGNPYDGSELAAHGNIIVVTINFRLGILGFLKTGGKESAQGNFGLMDLVAGLHWLKENLPAFGGDPQQITLLGHGTGAALANILVVSPVASDLIQHTVMVSGSALSPWAIQKNPLFVKRRVAEQTGCHGDMLYYDLAPCLRTKTVTELLAVKIDHPRFLVGFAPFVDGTVISPNTDSIAKLSLPLGSAIVSTSGIEFANFPKRNLIFCLTSVESHLDLNAQDLEFGFNETRRDRILRTYVRNNFHYHLNEIFAVLKNEYTDWDKAIRSPLSSRDATLQFLSDGHTASSLIKLGYMHSLRGGKGYFLHFKHRTVEEEYPQRTGSVRGEDVPFWLGLPISPLFPHNYTTQEKLISRLMLRYLANFAKTGNPNRSSLSSPPPSSSSLIASPSSSSSSSSSRTADESSEIINRSSFNIVNATSSTSSGPIKSSNIIEDVATAAAREALNLAVLYNQRRTKRTYYKRHSRSNDDHSGSASNEASYFISNNNNNNNNDNNNSNKLDSDELPFWDAYDVVNQLYMELGIKAEIQSHYRGHKLSMWLNLIPQLHRHANMNDQSMRHHQFQDDLNNLNLYEGIVRAQMQTKPDDDDETLLLPKGRLTTPPPAQETNVTQKPQGATTECGVDGAMFVAELTTLPPTDNRSLVLDSREKEMATASTGLIGNLEVLRRLSGKQFQSYTTALVATVAVGCFLLVLNILIFAGIYHQREKRARDAKTKEELQDSDTSKNSSMLKLNAMGSETGSFNDSGAGVSGKPTVVFGEYSCYDEKSLQTKDEKLIVELPPAQMVDANWAGCSTSTLDLLKTKHHTSLDTSYTVSNVVPINIERQTEPLMAVNNLEMVTYNPLPMASGLIIDPSFAATSSSSSGLLSKRGSFVGSSGQLNQYDYASVQSSDQMSFKDIENAVKASAAMNDAITQDDDIPEPPPPPRSFQSMQQQQQQQILQQANVPATTSGSGGGGILRQAGATSATQTGGGKKRVHIQEISV